MRSVHRLRFARPTEPLSSLMVDALVQVVAQVPGIAEAWWPECSMNGEPARQVLVIGIRDGYAPEAVISELMPKLRLLLAPRELMDVIPFPVADLPVDARIPQCRVYVAKAKPWWKVW